MAIELDRALQVGDVRVAALVRRTATRHLGRDRQSAWVARRPVAILIFDGVETKAFDVLGNPVSRDDLERISPGAFDAVAVRTPEQASSGDR